MTRFTLPFAWRRLSTWRKQRHWRFLLIGSLILIVATSAAAQTMLSGTETAVNQNNPVTYSQPTAYINATRLNLRAGPGTSFPILAKLKYADSVTILGYSEDGGWLFVQLANGLQGWVWGASTVRTLPDTAAAIQLESGQYIVTVTSWRLNLRAGAHTGHGILTKLENGDQLVVLGRSDDGGWLHVRTTSGLKGWVWREYTELTDVQPAVQPPTAKQQTMPQASSNNPSTYGSLGNNDIDDTDDKGKTESGIQLGGS